MGHFALCTITCLAVAASGCLDDPTTTNPIAVAATPTSVAADGASIVTLQVSAATDGDVTLTASTGSFLDAPVPSTGAPASTVVKTARGSTTIAYRAGLDTGTAIITASAGQFTYATSVMLMPSLPVQLVLSPNRTSVTGDGVSYVELQTEVFAASASSLVSRGTTLQYAVCCVDSNAQPTDCKADAPPLIIPRIARVDDGKQVTVRAVTTRATASAAAVLLARLDESTITGSLCSAPVTGEVRSNAMTVTVSPAAP